MDLRLREAEQESKQCSEFLKQFAATEDKEATEAAIKAAQMELEKVQAEEAELVESLRSIEDERCTFVACANNTALPRRKRHTFSPQYVQFSSVRHYSKFSAPAATFAARLWLRLPWWSFSARCVRVLCEANSNMQNSVSVTALCKLVWCMVTGNGCV